MSPAWTVCMNAIGCSGEADWVGAERTSPHADAATMNMAGRVAARNPFAAARMHSPGRGTESDVESMLAECSLRWRPGLRGRKRGEI